MPPVATGLALACAPLLRRNAGGRAAAVVSLQVPGRKEFAEVIFRIDEIITAAFHACQLPARKTSLRSTTLN